ncbi:mannitol dehydrogenase family protein [Sphingobium sp. YR768]|uniref:mannitol dehydrogenase family protein n=1 Tax=Sphingobium sp. YR768 TaxID=1884365 RepID=UPI0008B7D672|nr:mannitol dehydrogenase family protein [Sphingobium sp. YR768]SES11233.1 fructuronate reductase [Sphingobium sp. YR768]
MNAPHRLSAATLSLLPSQIGRADHPREAQAPAIVHFGIGAFHRAHQAWYTDRAAVIDGMAWTITGVSMRSASVADQLNPQDGLYSITTCSAQSRSVEVLQSVQTVLVASREPDAVIAAIASPHTHILTFTVTEKGYCRTADGSIDRTAAESGSIYPLLEAGLKVRAQKGLPGLTLLSCDNLANNGRQLEALLVDFVAARDPDLAQWIAAQCRFPCAMVDRIVPATTAQDRTAAALALGQTDEGAVVTEPFSQWVIEDRFAGPRPAWDQVGAELVADVAPYEMAKLRMLNGAHSALAYLGLARGHGFVHEAVADPAIRPVVEALMRDEALPSIIAASDQDLSAYADALLDRFANPALNHRLIQIAMDGSQKIPQRWLETLAHHQQKDKACPAILAALAAWRAHLRGDNVPVWGPVEDPIADRLTPLAQQDDAAFARALFGADGLFAAFWTANAMSMEQLMAALARA